MRRSGRSKWWFKSRKKDDAGDCIWVSPTLSFLLVFSWTSASALPDLWMQNSSHLLSHIQGWGLLRALQTFNMPPPCLLCTLSLPLALYMGLCEHSSLSVSRSFVHIVQFDLRTPWHTWTVYFSISTGQAGCCANPPACAQWLHHNCLLRWWCCISPE